jgi:hypothetical protein
MGLAKHNPGGQWRLGLSATAASAVLYSAIVLFGVGSASPSAPAAGRDPHASAVLMRPHADTVSGSAQRLPQASPEPRRHRLRARADRRHTGVEPAPTSSAPTSSAPSTVASPTPASPRETESESLGVTSSTTASVAVAPPVVSVPPISLPTVTVPLPDLPVQLPDVPVPAPPPLSLPLPPALP